MLSPITLASKAKGPLALLKRAHTIVGGYGITSAPMDRALQRFTEVLRRFDCGASFPITAVTLKRNSDLIARYRHQNIEFLVHGYTHVDFTQLTPEAQLSQLRRACGVFSQLDIPTLGFRSPYLCRTPDLNTLIEAAGFSYVCNQPILWDVLDADALDSSVRKKLKRAIDFYMPWSAYIRPSLPWLDNQIVEIPVSLPDDEILIERVDGTSYMINKAWLGILSETYQQGELFTLLLHPERIALCADVLTMVLTKARALAPGVWCARLDEIAAWWKARTNASIEVTDTYDCGCHCVVTGPPGTTVLTRAVDVDMPSLPWAEGYRQVEAMSFTFHCLHRPFIGLSLNSSPRLAEWLRQQGYIIEISDERHRYQCYFDQLEFVPEQERQLLAQIEKPDLPLVRLGRWPNGARSALCVTGDIDALTLWDYGLRLFGR